MSKERFSKKNKATLKHRPWKEIERGECGKSKLIKSQPRVSLCEYVTNESHTQNCHMFFFLFIAFTVFIFFSYFFLRNYLSFEHYFRKNLKCQTQEPKEDQIHPRAGSSGTILTSNQENYIHMRTKPMSV